MSRVVLMYGIFAPSNRHIEALRRWFDEVIVAEDEAHAVNAAQTAEAILGHRYLRQTLATARALRWVQTTAGGVERLPCRELRELGVVLTRVTFTAGIIARHALVSAWALTRAIPTAVNQQAAGEWRTDLPWLPLPRVAVVFGYGPIGQEITRLLRQDGIAVRVVTRQGRVAFAAEDGVSFFTAANADEATHGADWICNAMPDTPQTRGFFDRARLSRFSKNAVFVNVGRGSAVVTDDLCALLREGHLGGAALDVIEPSPPPPDHTVWKTPRLLLTPHIAAHSVERASQMEQFAEAQAERFRRGLPLQNVVDLAAIS